MMMPYHTFPVAEEIYTGNPALPALTMQAGYDYGLGVMTFATDFNEFTTVYGYDPFGRLTSISKPPDTGHTVEYAGLTQAPPQSPRKRGEVRKLSDKRSPRLRGDKGG